MQTKIKSTAKPTVNTIPDVRWGSENSILEGLGSHPANWQHALSVLPVVVCLVDVACHAKVYHQNIQLSHSLKEIFKIFITVKMIKNF